ncbi:unnamed protein product [Rotaria sordida]|uniref:Nuclear receptor domain-containing protein n=2 Tax=Rotaria sordida TaxID=392033 RepID=A0A819S5G8_9BILA|nr:unnamed protein product [Rotaria sordida]CAF4058739.1 unnamed protein product [Rotaria sordida]
MEVTPTEVRNGSTSTPSINNRSVRQKITSPLVCKVCGSSAQYSYYGAIVCFSCKVFFRRNALNRSVPLICNSGDHCEIHVNNRRICSSCRLAKCFASGMTVKMIRSSWTKQTMINRKKKSISTALVRLADRNQLAQIPTLNLLRSDISTLTVDQWNHLSNLVHCFDEHTEHSFIEHFIHEQSALPPKFRFKYASVRNFFTSMMSKVQLVFEKNRDIFSLSLHDRSTLLRSTVEYTTSIGGAVILRQAHLFDNPAFFKSAELIFRPSAVALTKQTIDQLDPDITFIKIIFAVVAFLISNYTVYTSTAPTNLTDAKKILRIQDIYTDLVWRYLIYKYNDHDAILCFSNFIRCLFLINDSVVEAHEAQQYTDIIDSVVEATQQKLTLNQ